MWPSGPAPAAWAPVPLYPTTWAAPAKIRPPGPAWLSLLPAPGPPPAPLTAYPWPMAAPGRPRWPLTACSMATAPARLALPARARLAMSSRLTPPASRPGWRPPRSAMPPTAPALSAKSRITRLTAPVWPPLPPSLSIPPIHISASALRPRPPCSPSVQPVLVSILTTAARLSTAPGRELRLAPLTAALTGIPRPRPVSLSLLPAPGPPPAPLTAYPWPMAAPGRPRWPLTACSMATAPARLALPARARLAMSSRLTPPASRPGWRPPRSAMPPTAPALSAKSRITRLTAPVWPPLPPSLSIPPIHISASALRPRPIC